MKVRISTIYYSFYVYIIRAYNTTVFSDEYDHASLYERIAVRCPSLTEISGKRIDDPGLLALSMLTNSTLTSVTFTDAIFTDSAVDVLCKSCCSLTCLVLEMRGFDDDIVTDEAVSSIVKHCPGIEHLSLSGWNELTDASLTALIALTSLKTLNLTRCSGLTSAGVQSMLRSTGANIEALILSQAGEDYPFQYCDDALLRCLGDCCPKLMSFSVAIESLGGDATEASLLAFIRGCPLLEALHLHSHHITDTVLIELADNCPRLAILKLGYGTFTDTGIATLSSKCKHLVVLSLEKPAFQSFVSISLQ